MHSQNCGVSVTTSRHIIYKTGTNTHGKFPAYQRGTCKTDHFTTTKLQNVINNITVCMW